MKNYKTTICGLVIAITQAVATYKGGHGWQGYVSAAAFAALGFFSKDFNISGAAK